MQNRSKLGSFWAFFPTEARTTLSGIINAPWKLDDARRLLLEGRFNQELLTEVLPKLVAKDFQKLAVDGEPATALDILPARGREGRNWADDAINEPIFDELRKVPSLPNCTGSFTRPRNLKIHPKGLQIAWLQQWFEVAPGLDDWVHPSVEAQPERRLKADRLMQDQRTSHLQEWIEWVCRSKTPQESANALDLVARIVRDSPEMGREARTCHVLTLEDGVMAEPKTGQVFIRSSEEEAGFRFIDPELVGIAGVRENLELLEIRVLDRSGELLNALSRKGPIDWRQVWELARRLPTRQAEEIFAQTLGEGLTEKMKVRTADNAWKPLSSVFSAGPVVPIDRSRDREFLIDPVFHGPDEELLRRLGAVDRPSVRKSRQDEPWLALYKDELRRSYIRQAKGAKPAEDKVLVEGPQPPSPLQNLGRVSPQACVAMTECAMALDPLEVWKVRHTSNPAYGVKTSISPTVWWVKRHGRLDTPFGPWPVDQCLSPDVALPPDLGDDLTEMTRNVLPIAEVSSRTAHALELPGDVDAISQKVWETMLATAGSWTDPDRRSLLYCWAVHYMEEAPKRIRVGSLDVPPREVAVLRERDKYKALIEQGLPALLVVDEFDKKALMENWGLQDGLRMLEQELEFEAAGEPAQVIDVFPGLRTYLDPDDYDLELVTCLSLNLLTLTPQGLVSSPVEGLLRERQVLVRGSDSTQVLRQISNALELDLSEAALRKLLERQEQERVRKFKAEIRRQPGDPERLALAVGPDDLRRTIPQAALEAIELERQRPLEPRELARMAIAVHGADVLKQNRSALEKNGLEPPQQWAGRAAARRFVGELGFSQDYAGFPEARRPATLDVEGPVDLAPLHDYQTLAADRIKALLRDEGPPRGMLALPTGAGKTRVAVQAVVEEIRDGNLEGPLLWIAQSDELCEQAVQTWGYVWRAVGAPNRLVISRFWGSNDAAEESDATQLVVATPDKLLNAAGKDNYAWMTQMSLVVVDEAHSSVAASYTKVLEWLGRGRSRKSKSHLIGLTATPFRNVNQAETQRLAARYDHHRLDEGAFVDDPYAVLQSKGVLAQVRQELLPGVDVELTASDREEIKTLMRVPAAVQTRIGASIERNRRIVESVATLPDDWTVLLFATTVENAGALAAQLSLRGIPSVAISANTEPAARRRYIEQFKAGDLRVITNYNVLTQGFDAPAVKAVYVTRPTFSANLYQQMIGRGLRGPLNGGSEEVLIVNVKDNFQAFGEKLAFTHFEYLWGEDGEEEES
jgi:superfamily II DNA or RNA helicase